MRKEDDAPGGDWHRQHPSEFSTRDRHHQFVWFAGLMTVRCAHGVPPRWPGRSGPRLVLIVCTIPSWSEFDIQRTLASLDLLAATAAHMQDLHWFGRATGALNALD
jgi:hypothetical protein